MIEYDPNRTAFIALICYRDVERRYMLVPADVKVGDIITVSADAPLNQETDCHCDQFLLEHLFTTLNCIQKPEQNSFVQLETLHQYRRMTTERCRSSYLQEKSEPLETCAG